MPWRCAELWLGGTQTPKTKLTHRPSQLKTLQHNSSVVVILSRLHCHHVWIFLRRSPCRGGGRLGAIWAVDPRTAAGSTLCELLPSNHHPADSRPFTNICMRFEDQQKMFFPVGWPSSPPPRGVVMNSRSSGLVYGELGTPSREVWERRNHQFWTHSSQNRLPLESS